MSSLEYIKGLRLTSEKGRLLQFFLIELIQSGDGFPTKGGKPNVEFLSSKLGISRQNFYAGRSAVEFFDLLNWAVRNLTHVEHKKNDSSNSYSDLVSSYRSEVLRLRSENARLRSQIESMRSLYNFRYGNVEIIF